MEIKLTWYGHGTWLVTAGDHKILLDPFFNESPSSPIKAAEMIEIKPDVILVSHGHFDHVADVHEIATATGAQLFAIYEVAEWFGKQGIENRVGMNIGGVATAAFGQIEMTQALHSSSLPDGSYGGQPAGFVLHLAVGDSAKKVYFACDTGLFSDMQLIGQQGIDVAVLPIGDLFTMGPSASIEAVKLIQPDVVLPAHYNTWPPIEQNADQWAEDVKTKTGKTAVVLQPGDSYNVN